MRLKIELSGTNQNVPKNTQSKVNSFIHNAIGRNNQYHDSKSDYCISNLCGGKLNEDKLTLSFNNDSFIIVTSTNMEFINKLIVGLMNNRDFGYGISFKNVSFIDEVLYDGYNHFFTLTPVLIKGKEETDPKYITIKNIDQDGKYTIDNPEYTKRLKEHIINKFTKIDPTVDFNGFDIVIDYPTSKVKSVIVKDIKNWGSTMKMTVYGNKKLISLIYNFGLGQSTGSGFGTIYKTENHEAYKYF